MCCVETQNGRNTSDKRIALNCGSNAPGPAQFDSPNRPLKKASLHSASKTIRSTNLYKPMEQTQTLQNASLTGSFPCRPVALQVRMAYMEMVGDHLSGLESC